MEKIGSRAIWSFFDNNRTSRPASNHAIRAGCGHPVGSYFELAQKLAELQFLNRDHVLLFRGQANDYLTSKGNSMMKASIFRHEGKKVPSKAVLEKRFETLQIAEKLLVEAYCDAKLKGYDRLRRHRLIRWAILQHYEICKTPLLDVTHSLRVAASFATDGNGGDEAYLYAFGVPNLSGAVTASSEAGLQIVRLSSACPPDAVRPHIQEGYLVGEYPEIPDYEQHSHYAFHEMDFGRRLVAKFRLDLKTLWTSENYQPATHEALYPSARRDPLLEIANAMIATLNQKVA
jgi:hypothetical protein